MKESDIFFMATMERLKENKDLEWQLLRHYRKYADKKVLLCFTGGMDSYVSLCCLMEVKAKVTLCYVEQEKHPAAEIELGRVTRISEALGLTVYVPSVSPYAGIGNSFRHPQLVMNIFLSAGISFSYDYLVMSHLADDGVAKDLEAIEEIWDKLNSLRFYATPLAELSFPLLGMEKTWLHGMLLSDPWRKLKPGMSDSEFHEIIDASWFSCERPDTDNGMFPYIACGKCKPCRTVISANGVVPLFLKADVDALAKVGTPKVEGAEESRLKRIYYGINRSLSKGK